MRLRSGLLGEHPPAAAERATTELLLLLIGAPDGQSHGAGAAEPTSRMGDQAVAQKLEVMILAEVRLDLSEDPRPPFGCRTQILEEPQPTDREVR